MNWGSNSATSTQAKTPGPSPQPTQFSSPTHHYASTAPSPRAPSTPIHQSRSPNDPKPDYSRSHFSAGPNTKTKPNAVPVVVGTGASIGGDSIGSCGGGADIFADILGSQGYNFASKNNIGPRSINEMRKDEMVKDMDPDKLKMLEWVREMQNFFVFNNLHFIGKKLFNLDRRKEE